MRAATAAVDRPQLKCWSVHAARSSRRSSMQFARPILSVGFLLALWGTLRGQGGSPDSATVRAAVATLHSDLRNFVVAQEAYFADHVTYRHSYGFRHQSQ